MNPSTAIQCTVEKDAVAAEDAAATRVTTNEEDVITTLSCSDSTAARSSADTAADTTAIPLSYSVTATVATTAIAAAHPPSQHQRAVDAELQIKNDNGSSSSSSSSNSSSRSSSSGVALTAPVTVDDVSTPSTSTVMATAATVKQQSVAARVYPHALHSIYRFLTLHDFVTVAARVCRHWLNAAVTLPPLQLSSRSDNTTIQVERRDRLNLFLVSRLRHECSHLSINSHCSASTSRPTARMYHQSFP